MSIQWTTVERIVKRELRDQLRDRRTLFMVVVLPLVFFPMVGFGMLKLTPSLEREVKVVALMGGELLPEVPPLLSPDESEFYDGLFDSAEESHQFRVLRVDRDSAWGEPEEQEKRIRDNAVEALIILPRDLPAYLRQERATRGEIRIVHNGADERSLLTYARLRMILDRWNEQVMAFRLAMDGKPFSYAAVFRSDPEDVSTAVEAGGSIWARLFPFLLVMMSLTGAFYPSIDICAGERERGTLESLLTTPASRGEIVIGKYLTVSLASFATSFLNLSSMAVTGWQVAHDFQSIRHAGSRPAEAILSAPPLGAILWMLVLLVPMSLFFGAVSVAIAGMARSMKEGQHWMTPLILVTVPLAMASMTPSVELNLASGLVPVLGISILLRELMQGEYDLAQRYASLVMISTLFYGMAALRVAIAQFHREAASFRDAEKLDIAARIRHMLRKPPPFAEPASNFGDSENPSPDDGKDQADCERKSKRKPDDGGEIRP